MAEVATHPSALPPAPAVMAILSRFDCRQLEGFIAVAIDLADSMDSNPDEEPATWPENIHARDEASLPDDYEPTGDEETAAWVEWHTRGRCKDNPGVISREGLVIFEDDEEDNEDCGHDEAEPDMQSYPGEGAGCPISDIDKAVDDDACDEPYQDMELNQMADDVPMLPVMSVEHNIFTDARVPLGISNLQSSYVGENVLSADTGANHSGRPPDGLSKPGEPV